MASTTTRTGAAEHAIAPERREVEGVVFELRDRRCPTCLCFDERVLGMRGGVHHRYKKGTETRIVQCNRCSLIYPNPFPYLVDAQAAYGDVESYFAGVDEEAKVESYRPLVREGIRRTRLKGENVSLLDVGAGRGEMLRAAKLEGLTDVVGVDVSHAMAEHARHRGVVVMPTTLEHYAADSARTFDIVVLSSVLEHVDDPDSLMSAVAQLTHRGSMIYVELPCEPHLLSDIGRIVSRLRRSPAVYNLAPTFPPYHVFGFNPKALGALLRKHRFTIEELHVRSGWQVPSNGTPIDRAKAFAATQVNRLGNILGRAGNMDGWARRQ